MTSIERLIARYEKAEKDLIKIIVKKTQRGNVTAYYESLLRQTRAVLVKLRKDTPALVNSVVTSGYEMGLKEMKASTSFSILDERQIALLELNAEANLLSGINLVGRHMDDVFRAAALEATAQKLTQGQTVKDMQKRLLASLTGAKEGVVPMENGTLGIRYKNGRIVPLSKYSAMVARTTTGEAATRASLQRGEEWGDDLVSCTVHHPTCEVCAKFAGRVYATTREAANGKYFGLQFPYLYETALSRGYYVIHPNCIHAFISFSAGAYTYEELKEISERSMKPFVDNRSEAERRAYNDAQATNRRRRYDEIEYDRIRAILPDEAPKNFGAYRIMKASNSERYQDLKKDYRYVLSQISTAEPTEEEVGAIKKYISAESYTLNHKLREGLPLTEQEEVIVKTLDSALLKMPKYEGAVYRSMTSTMMPDADAFFLEHQEGSAVPYPAYTSSGTTVYDENMDIQLIIQSKNGRDLRVYNVPEFEILFPRDSRFIVEKREGNTIWMREA